MALGIAPNPVVQSVNRWGSPAVHGALFWEPGTSVNDTHSTGEVKQQALTWEGKRLEAVLCGPKEPTGSWVGPSSITLGVGDVGGLLQAEAPAHAKALGLEETEPV